MERVYVLIVSSDERKFFRYGILFEIAVNELVSFVDNGKVRRKS